LVGCGGPAKYEVSGTVTVDGEPVEMGEILFITPDHSVNPFATQIRNGAYRISVQDGSYIVQINAMKAVPLPNGQKNSYGETAPRRQYLPPRYNSESHEKLDVHKSLEKDYSLSSK
jgi:hypothetical protein